MPYPFLSQDFQFPGRDHDLTARQILDFSTHLNPLGMPEWLRPILSAHISSLVQYPDPDAAELRRIAAKRYGVTPAQIMVGNGCREWRYLLPRATGKTRAVIPVPADLSYAAACVAAGLPIVKLPLSENQDFALAMPQLDELLCGDELVWIGQPNNPTGLACAPELLAELAAKHVATLFVIDETFADFVTEYSGMARHLLPNVVVLRSLSPMFAIPGLPLGCLLANESLIERLRCWQAPCSVGALAQAVGREALTDDDYVQHSCQYVRQQREELTTGLLQQGNWKVYPSQAHFILLRSKQSPFAARTLAAQLLHQHIVIRPCDDFDGLDRRFFRVAVRTAEENGRLLDALAEMDDHYRVSSRRKRRRTPALMFQGTGSNAGKSLLTAAFCRILLQDGYRVAPFKAQNMSLNSFVTADGGEIGRAQALQAQACRIAPDTRMNPVLLKPHSSMGAQVIVRGQVVDDMGVAEYSRYKQQVFKQVGDAYDSLAAEYDVVVLEGAGSPAEVNLKNHDIANMAMARYAQAPVLLVGDIDRGGVYAAFVGTMEVLAEWERRLVAGLVVNRFRGQADLLGNAHDYVQRHSGVPVLGVVPYLADLGLPEEDSVTFKEQSAEEPAGPEQVTVALIDLPHIANFTDFDVLKLETDVHVRVVRYVDELGQPDVVILPGSKNVLADLTWLQHNGLAERILRMAAADQIELVGICGGYQMLGRQIADPYGIESTGTSMPGLGLLPLTTKLARRKTLQQVAAWHRPSGLPLHGYEIHHGYSEGENMMPIICRQDGAIIGGAAGNRRVWGTYLHGLFDADEFRHWFVDQLRRHKGLAPRDRLGFSYDLEPALDRLAAAVRVSVQLDKIYQLMAW